MIHLMLLNIAFFYFMCVTMMVCNVCANHCAAFISDNEIRFITVNCKLSLYQYVATIPILCKPITLQPYL